MLGQIKDICKASVLLQNCNLQRKKKRLTFTLKYARNYQYEIVSMMRQKVTVMTLAQLVQCSMSVVSPTI